MYNVAVNNSFAQVSSYEKATAFASGQVARTIATMQANAATVATGKLYRSPKARARVASDMLRSAEKLNGAFKFPKKATPIDQRMHGVRVSIAKVG